MPNIRSQMREKARPIFAESGRSLSSTIRRYTYGRDYGPREPVSAVFSLCLFFVCLGGHDDRRQPAGYGRGAGDGNCSATDDASRSGHPAKAPLWSVSPQASAVLTDAGGLRLGSLRLADAARRQFSRPYPGAAKQSKERSALQRARFQWSIGR